MTGIGIFDADLIVVDRSLKAGNGSTVIAAVNGEPFCKPLRLKDDSVILRSENPSYPARYILEGEELMIWGVVRHFVRTYENPV